MKNNSYRSLILVSVLVFICLLPILRSGLYSDDLPNFETRSSFKHIPAFDFVGRSQTAIKAWKQCGRYNPVALYQQNFVFDQFKSVFAYKCYILFCNVLAIASFGFLLYALGLSVQFITLSLFFYLAEIQFRIQYHDAFTSLQGLYPLFTAAFFLSIAFISLYLNSGRKYFYIISLLFAATALLLSEVGVILIPMYLAVIFFSTGGVKKKTAIVTPALLVCFIYLAYVLYLRSNQTAVYSGLQTGFKPEGMLNVLNVQLFSALPFSNLYKVRAIPELLFKQIISPANLVSVIVIITAGIYLIYSAIKNYTNGSKYKYFLLFALSIILFLVPAVVLMPSTKYQLELSLGAGYLPVYVQNFGVALFFSLIACYCLKSTSGLLKKIFILFASVNVVAALIALLFNSGLIDTMNYNKSYPAEAMYGAIKRGVLSSVPAGSNIILTRDYFWRDESDYAMIMQNETAKNFQVFDLEDTPYIAAGGAKRDCFLLECNKGDTIYTRLYQMNCNTGVKERIVAIDTVFHKTRLSEVEEPILAPRP